ncbi:MAG: Lrp/AsnC family transcriptional regulator [Pseudopedobacter saltans]|uniref:Lrp/AsnC family transcriptional regulator n=1 Tax=Pseudopedobacter saltans TaxID=151895 RepID=A0A2W5GTE3_9SPHI|nr:MAG: Lrp/AsnC family transcriptional regulator [Pseudopedobacter saltans]
MDRIELDQVDFQILRILQENARMSNADLARELGMAPSGVLERVRKLEQKGAIEGYEVKINPAYIGQNLLAFISVKTSDIFGSDATGKALAKIPEIQEVHNITGEFCFLVKARVADSAALMDLMRNHMAKIKTIASTETIMVLETVKDSQKMIIP